MTTRCGWARRWAAPRRRACAAASMRWRFIASWCAETLKARFQRVAPAPACQVRRPARGCRRVEILRTPRSDADGRAGDWTVNDSDNGKSNAGVEVTCNVPGDRHGRGPSRLRPPPSWLQNIAARRAARRSPFLVRLAARRDAAAGEHRLLIRAMRGGRLSIDGKVVRHLQLFPKILGPGARRRRRNRSPINSKCNSWKPRSCRWPTAKPQPPSSATASRTSYVRAASVEKPAARTRPAECEPSRPTGSPGACSPPARSRSISPTKAGSNLPCEQRACVAEIAAERRANADELAYWKSRHDLARAEIAKMPPR